MSCADRLKMITRNTKVSSGCMVHRVVTDRDPYIYDCIGYNQSVRDILRIGASSFCSKVENSFNKERL